MTTSMEELAELEQSDVGRGLEALVREYGDWLREQREIENIRDRYVALKDDYRRELGRGY